MDELLKNPLLISAAVASLGIGFPILIAYLKGWLPTITQDREKTARIAYLEEQVRAKDALILSLPTRSELDTVKVELESVRKNLRADLDNRDRTIVELNTYSRQLVQDVFNQQESVQSVTSTLASLAQQLPVLVFSIQQYITREKENGAKN